jgi:hypothetical protein
VVIKLVGVTGKIFGHLMISEYLLCVTRMALKNFENEGLHRFE